MAWDQRLTDLNDLLASLYVLTRESLRVVDAAGLPKAYIAFQERAIDNWHAILSEAERRGKVDDLIAAARRDYPDDPLLAQAARGEPITLKGPVADQDFTWQGELSAETLEKIIGRQSTLLPISFLTVGLERSRSVARVELPGGLGSGFLTRGNLFVTNHHVIADEDDAEEAVLHFNYQKTAAGLDQQPVEVRLDPDRGFATSQENDWTLCRVRGDANADWGAIEMAPAEIRSGERVIIIQHPAGGPKQIAFYHNLVTYADPRRVQYLTDTLPGSSGSPVFDDEWRLVAVHHSGGHIREPGTKALVFRNEGIRVDAILADSDGLALVASGGA